MLLVKVCFSSFDVVTVLLLSVNIVCDNINTGRSPAPFCLVLGICQLLDILHNISGAVNVVRCCMFTIEGHSNKGYRLNVVVALNYYFINS